jgi:hypothetical protein
MRKINSQCENQTKNWVPKWEPPSTAKDPYTMYLKNANISW